jgi:transposase-like protein
MTKRKRREYTKKVKSDAVRLVKEGGKSAFQVARDLDLTPSALCK